MKNALTAAVVLLLSVACNKEKFFDGPNFYEDDFETYEVLDELLLPDDERWSFTQLTRDANYILVDTAVSQSGERALKFFAKQSSDGDASKASIAKQNMAFWEGETVRLSAWFYIEGMDELRWLFLMDFEEQTAVGAGPGMRLALVDNRLRVEYKFNEDDLLQTEGDGIEFPRNQWVEVVWELVLSQEEQGEVRLCQDGQRIIERSGIRTLPRDLLYFQQGTKGMYSSCEIGITANSESSDCTLWVDNVRFERIDG